MDKQTFLDTLHGERTQWEALVAQVGEERMTQPGFAGEWSLKDVIAHIAVYYEHYREHMPDLKVWVKETTDGRTQR